MKKVLIFVIFFATNITTFSQALPPPQTEKTYTEMFDSVFSVVSKAQATTKILYERVAPFAGLQNFNSSVSFVDTSNSKHFMRAYRELYDAAFEPFAKLPFDGDSLKSLIGDSGDIVDIVDIGILHYKFNMIDSVVAMQKLIIVDSVLVGEDTTVTASLYSEKTAFVVSPLSSFSETEEVTFRFNNAFYFDNTGATLTSLMVDFDDGLGLRSVLMGSDVFVSYPSIGEKTLQFVATYSNGQTKTGYATINVLMLSTNKNPQSKWPWMGFYTGMYSISSKITPPDPYNGGVFQTSSGNVWIYYANADKKLRKPLLLIDGFDPENKRQFESHKEKGEESIWDLLKYKDIVNGVTINRHLGDSLLKLGFDLVVLDLPDGGGWIERNAMVCIEVINWINKMLALNCSEHQIIVVGPSMGGQVARYALAYMEQNPGPNTNDGNHNVSLYVSFDSPHQGANIPIGAQAFIKANAKDQYKEMLLCPAAKQMLIHHREDGADKIHKTYYEKLDSLGYPQNCRKITISNGSLNNKGNEGTAGGKAFRATIYFPYFLIGYTRDYLIRNTPHQGGSIWAFETTHYGLIIPFPGARHRFANETAKCSPDIAPGSYFNTYDVIRSGILKEWKATTAITTNQSTHCFMPTPSVLDISNDPNHCGTLPNYEDPNNLVVQGRIPFVAYWGPEGYNMRHVGLNQSLATWFLKQIDSVSGFLSSTKPKVLKTIKLYISASPSKSSLDTLIIYDVCDAVFPDTIYFKNRDGIEKCLPDDGSDYAIIFPEELPRLFFTALYINDSLVTTSRSHTNHPNEVLLILSNYKKIWTNPTYDKEYIIVKAVLIDGREIIFKIKVRNDVFLANSAFLLWSELFDFGGLTLEGNTISIEADLLENGLKLPLPDLDDCILEVKADSTVSWSLDTVSNSIVFAPTDECDISAQLIYRCACLGVLNINIRNTNATVRPLATNYHEPNSPVIVSPDGKSGTILLEFNEEGEMEECCIPLNCKEIAESMLAITASDTNSFETAPHLRIDTVDEVEIFSICFQLDSVACFASFEIETDCNGCGEVFSFRLFNTALLTPPKISRPRKICSGGALLVAEGGDDCGLGLSSRWIRIYEEEVECEDCEGEGVGCGNCEEGIVVVEKEEEVEEGRNSNSVEISKKGRYRKEYFHKNDTVTVIFDAEIVVEEEDLEAEELPFTALKITDIKKVVSERDDETGKFRCRFTVWFQIEGVDTTKLNDYKFRTVVNGNTVDIRNNISSKKDRHWTSFEVECSEGEGEFDIVIEIFKDDDFVCQQVFPAVSSCGCENPCDDLEAWLAKENKFEQRTTNSVYCIFEFELPPGFSFVEDGVHSKGEYTPLSNGGNGFSFEMSSIPPGALITTTCGSSYTITFTMTVTNGDDICTITRIFSCTLPGGRILPDTNVVVEVASAPLAGGMIAHYEIPDEYIPFFPVEFWVADNTQNKLSLLRIVSDSAYLKDSISFSVSSFSPGFYTVIADVDGHIAGSAQFEIEGVIKYVEAVPNPDSQGNLTINYAFNSMPQGAIRISVVDMLGNERAVVYNGVVGSLIGSIPANVNHLSAGTYYIKLEAIVENETATFQFIKQ